MGIFSKLRGQQKERQLELQNIKAEDRLKDRIKAVKAIEHTKGFEVLINYWEDKYQSLDSYLKSNQLDKDEVYRANYEKNIIGNHLAFIVTLLESEK